LREPPAKKLVFVLDKHNRVLTKKSMHKLLSELFHKALGIESVDAVVINGSSINDCNNFSSQIIGRNFAEWEVIYFHENDLPPVLLNEADKQKLTALLPKFIGTSAEAVYKVLADAGAYN